MKLIRSVIALIVIVVLSGCSQAAMTDASPSTATVTTTMTVPPTVTVTSTMPPVTITPPTVTTSVMVGDVTSDDQTPAPYPVSDTSSADSVVVSAQPLNDSNGNPMILIDSETNVGIFGCNDVLGPVETLGGQPGGCEWFDQDTWNQIVANDPSSFSQFSKSTNIWSTYWQTAFTPQEQLYIGLTACEALSTSKGGSDMPKSMAALRTMEPIIIKWFHDRVNLDVMKTALTEAGVTLCPYA